MDTFVEWLQAELRVRDWTQADLARRSRVSQTHLSRIVNGSRKPGPEALVSIARALRIQPEEVFRQAGIIPPSTAHLTPRDERLFDELVERIAMLSPDDQRLVLELVERIDRIEQR